jgi:hypothetical protein
MISISSYEQIRHRAYELFLERRDTGRKGDALSDWLEAEEEIRSRRMPVGAQMQYWHFAHGKLPSNLVWPQTTLAPPRPHPESIRQPA